MARRGRGRRGSTSAPARASRGRGRGSSASRTSGRRSTRGISKAQRRAQQREREEAAQALKEQALNSELQQAQSQQTVASSELDVVQQQALQYEERVREIQAQTPPPPVPVADEDKDNAFVDENSIIYLNDEINSEMQYAPLYTDINEDLDYVSIVVYSGDNEVTSITVSVKDNLISIEESLFTINVLELVRDRLGLGNGQYNIHVTVYRNYIYNDENFEDVGDVQVEEISPSRFEMRVKTTLPKYYNSVEEYSRTSRFREDFTYQVIWPALLRDQERRIDLLASNWVPLNLEGESEDHIIFRFTEPLSRDIRIGDQFTITRDIVSPFEIPVTVDLESITLEEFNELRGPNYKAVDYKNKPAKSTEFETWDTILGSDPSTKQSILDTYISGSTGVNLNLDFRKYENFVHFSSAEERLKNFKYKLELIEYYTSQSNMVSTGLVGKAQSSATSSAEFLQNKSNYDTKKNNIISGFDDYEKYLYYESHSYESNSYGIYHPATWPKSNSNKPYTLLHTTSSEGKAWYASQLASASLYDDTNNNILRNTIPQHILQDSNSDNYTLFIDMIGQHFDTIYNHIDQITNTVDREESIYEGLSKDLIYDTAKSFGWTLQSGFDSSKLWQYVLGTDETGSYNSGNTYVREQSYSQEDLEKQTWKRIINNIPYLLKTKGTARGIKALLNTYGIPTTILRVQEYGGPAPTRPLNTRREVEKFSYALNFSGSSHITTEHSSIHASNTNFNFTNTTNRYTPMYEFRFDTSVTQSMHLVSSEVTSSLGASKIEVILEHSSSADYDSIYRKYGRLQFKLTSGSANDGFTTMSTDYAPFYDNDWWNVSFGTEEYVTTPSSTTRPTFTIRYAKIGEHADDITHSGSTSFTPADVTATKRAFNSTWAIYSKLIWGGTGSGLSTSTYNAFSGSMQEIRGWAEHISDKSFYQHALSPISITGDSIESAYNDLILRYPLGTDNKKYNHSIITNLSTTGSIPNSLYVKPFNVLSTKTDANFVGWPDSNTSYSNKSERYYVDVPNTIGSTNNDSKIRIENNSLRLNQLAWDKSFETSPNDSNPLDTEQLSVAFSPQDQIDLDIAMQFGGFSLDDYIGDPRDKFSNEYSTLKKIQNLYFKKYSDRYNIWAFIRMLKYINVGFWKQIESILPARADATVGVIIRPNILERHKVKDIGVISITDNAYNAQLTMPEIATVSAEVPQQRAENRDLGIYSATVNLSRKIDILSQIDTLGLENTHNTQGNSSTGYTRLTRVGTKLSSTTFNAPSQDTPDGAPAVEFFFTNPNKLFAGENSELGISEEPFGSSRPRGGATEMGDLTVE